MTSSRCGECANCIDLERVRRSVLKCANPPTLSRRSGGSRPLEFRTGSTAVPEGEEAMTNSRVVTFTREQVLEMLDEEHHPTILGWLDRGDGVAVYQNEAFDSVDLGHKQFVSFGSKSAQLETDDPPTRLPDIGGAINWRYQLIGTHREKADDKL